MRILSTLSLTGVLSLAILTSCEKEEGVENPIKVNEKIAVEFQEKVIKKGFVVTEFYADKPIDYVTTDNEIILETDLNKYIFPHLKDDLNVLKTDGTLEIHQNELLKPRNDSAILYRTWAITSNKNGVFMNFVNEYYNPLKYKLEEFNEDYFILSVGWPTDGARLISRFDFIEY